MKPTNLASDPNTGEQLYLFVYERVAEKSDYMQPDEYRQLLPDGATLAGVMVVVGAILGGVANGFLSKVGAILAERAEALLKRLTSEKCESEEVAAILSDAVPLLRDENVNWNEITALIALELTRKHIPFQVSQEVAREIAAEIQQQLSARDD